VIPDPTDVERVRLPATFDQAAEDYDRTRPVCPPELFDELIEQLRGPAHRRPEGGARQPPAAREPMMMR
jgi:hypothetical protein